MSTCISQHLQLTTGVLVQSFATRMPLLETGYNMGQFFHVGELSVTQADLEQRVHCTLAAAAHPLTVI